MKSLLFVMFVALWALGCGTGETDMEKSAVVAVESPVPPSENQKKDATLLSGVDGIVNWIMFNYSSLERDFAKAENDLRYSDLPVLQILERLKSIVSGRIIQSKQKKIELNWVKENLKEKELKVEREIGMAKPSMRKSYQALLAEIETKFEEKVEPLEDFDFQFLEKFESDLNASIVHWKRYVSINTNLLDPQAVRNKVADLISDHFRENMLDVIRDRRMKWEKTFETKIPSVPESEWEQTERLARGGDKVAQAYLGWMYFDGKGVAQDYNSAVKWFTKSAVQGYAQAQYSLGIMYADGLGVSADEGKAIKWYRESAEQGNAHAQFGLGRIFANQESNFHSYSEAIKWYGLSANQGVAAAQYNIGVMYDLGQGLIKDDKEAVKWYRKAAVQGDAMAQHNLGMKYANGEGVAKDTVEAYAWYSIALANGFEDARHWRDKLELTDEQLEEADRPEQPRSAHRLLPGFLSVQSGQPGTLIELSEDSRILYSEVLRSESIVFELPSKRKLRVVCSLQGHQSFEKTVSLEPNERKVMSIPVLERRQGWVRIEADASYIGHSQAALMLNGVNIAKKGRGDFQRQRNGKVAINIGPLEFGQHLIRITHPDYVPWERKIEIVEEAILEIYPTPLILTATLVVKAEPVGSEIYVDGQFKGVTPSEILLYAQKDYEVIVRLTGYDQKIRKIRLRANQKMDLNFGKLVSFSERMLAEYRTRAGDDKIVLKGKGIRDLSAFAKLDQTTSLDLSNNEITDVSPIAKLGKLKWLNLSGNKIQDIRPLKGLDNLEYLDLSSNFIEIVSPLKELPKLNYLNLVRQKWTPRALNEKNRGIRQYMIKVQQRFIISGMKDCEVKFEPTP